MNEKSKDEALDILNAINDKDIQREVKNIQMQENDPLMSLKNVLFKFFEKRLHIILKEEEFKDIVRDSLIADIENNEFSVAQKMALYNDILHGSTVATSSILDIFKPSKEGTVSPLVQPQDTSHVEDPTLKNFENLNGEDRESLQTLSAILNEVQKTLQEKNKEKDE